MLGPKDLLGSILHEIEIVKHLAKKVPPGGHDYRPSLDQRSTLELLQYLSMCALGGCYAVYDGDYDRYRELARSSESVTAEGFEAAIDAQAERLETFFAELSDETFERHEATHPLDGTMPLQQALLEVPVKWMTAYRMQLFLYCKAAGNDAIWSPNCWGGVDMERPEKD